MASPAAFVLGAAVAAAAAIRSRAALRAADKTTEGFRPFREPYDPHHRNMHPRAYEAPKIPYHEHRYKHNEQNMGCRIYGGPGHPPTPWKAGEVPEIRWARRFWRRVRIRSKVLGTAARPRVAMFKSKKNMYATVIDDTVGLGVALCTSNTRMKHIREELQKLQGCKPGEENTWGNQAAEVVGKDLAKKCLEHEITLVVQDRGGFSYQKETSRIRTVMEAIRGEGVVC